MVNKTILITWTPSITDFRAVKIVELIWENWSDFKLKGKQLSNFSPLKMSQKSFKYS